MERLRSILWSIDTLVGVLGAIVALILIGGDVSLLLIEKMSWMIITSSSLLFSIYFVSVNFIFSSSEDEFVLFLIRDGFYDELLYGFKWTMGALFVSLLFGAMSYLTAVHLQILGESTVASASTVIMFGVYVYAVAAAVLAVFDIIKFSQRRANFIRNRLGK